MLFDLNQSTPSLESRFDVCIVGSGPAGIALARRLVENNQRLSVCILESGGFELEHDTQSLYEGQSIGDPYFELQATRLRQFGGTTGHWSGWCIPMSEIDFQARSWIPDSGWPVTRQDLQAYYETATRFLLQKPPGFSFSDWSRHLSDLPPMTSRQLETLVWQFSDPPVNIGQYYRQELENARNITVLLHANALPFTVDDSGRHLPSIDVVNLSRTAQLNISAHAYVLACGGIENSRMLLASRTGGRGGVGNEHDQVGRYYMDHILTSCASLYTHDMPVRNALLKHELPSSDVIRPGFKLADTLQQEQAIANAIVYLSPKPEPGQLAVVRALRMLDPSGDHDTSVLQYLKYSAILLRDLDTLAVLAGTRLKGRSPGNPKEAGGDADFQILSEQVPDRASRILLSGDRDALDIPRVQLNWLLSDLDHDTVRKTVTTSGSILAQQRIGRLKLNAWLTGRERRWPELPVCSNHHMGGTRMHLDASQGVVNDNCRVHGVDNLYIAGSSVFPTGGFANPTLTIVALAQRLADHLALEKLGKRA